MQTLFKLLNTNDWFMFGGRLYRKNDDVVSSQQIENGYVGFADRYFVSDIPRFRETELFKDCVVNRVVLKTVITPDT